MTRLEPRPAQHPARTQESETAFRGHCEREPETHQGDERPVVRGADGKNHCVEAGAGASWSDRNHLLREQTDFGLMPANGTVGSGTAVPITGPARPKCPSY
jgi:hypothetical protein